MSAIAPAGVSGSGPSRHPVTWTSGLQLKVNYLEGESRPHFHTQAPRAAVAER